MKRTGEVLATETATTTGTDGTTTENKSTTATTTQTANGVTTATTTATGTETATAADGTKTTTETTEQKTVSTTVGEDGKTSGSGTVSGTAVRTEADGSTTTTVTEATATTTDSEGNVTVAETVATDSVAADGSTGSVVVTGEGELISADIVISEEALDTAQKTDTPIQAPVTIPVAGDAGPDTPPVSVKFQRKEHTGSYTVPKMPRVEIGVKGNSYGIVAFQKLAGGLLRLVKECRMGSVIVPVEGDCELVIVDNSKTFGDVAADAWYANYVTFVTAREIFNGDSLGMFNPDADMDRAMITQVLYNFDRNGEPGTLSAFVDAGTDRWWADAVGWANKNGIVGGYSDEWFAAEDSVTRQDLVAMLYRYAGFAGYAVDTGDGLSDWADADDVADYARTAMSWALRYGIIEGLDGNLSPTSSATRAQVAAIMMRFVSNVR